MINKNRRRKKLLTREDEIYIKPRRKFSPSKRPSHDERLARSLDLNKGFQIRSGLDV